MKFSLNWLKEYANIGDLDKDTIAKAITLHSFEIEGVEDVEYSLNGKLVKDTIFDIDILPNRGADALCHFGMAKEISTILNLDLKEIKIIEEDGIETDLKISIESDLCDRYIGRKINNIKISDSPDWLKNKLNSIGEKSINNIVDATNYVMFSTNQPMHAFDADKIDGDIVVRMSKEGEKMITLDNKEVELTGNELIIADSKDPLALAGIKGGKKAEVNKDTKNIILESAHFDPTYISTTSRRIKIMTDSSKRFENGISNTLANNAMDMLTNVICQLVSDSNCKVEKKIDIIKKAELPAEVSVSLDKINKHLGTNISAQEVGEILNRLRFNFENNGDTFLVTPPTERSDIKIPVDVIEEVGRIYGFDKLPEVPLKESKTETSENKQFVLEMVLKEFLTERGFDEVYTYAFVDSGELEVEKPIASDKGFLRSNLESGNKKSLEKNLLNADLLGKIEAVKQFEIGTVFEKNTEKRHLSLAVAWRKKAKQKEKEYLKELVNEIKTEHKIAPKIIKEEDFYIELDITDLDIDGNISNWHISKPFEYQTYSKYPFIVRDIAVFVPKETDRLEIIDIIKEHAGGLLIKETLFDEYHKDDKISFAHRLVFQSKDKTLTDEEINPIMEKIEKDMNDRGWEVR